MTISIFVSEAPNVFQCILKKWCTFGLPIAIVKSGKVYYEFTIFSENWSKAYPQAGWATPEFEKRLGEYSSKGCGDDEFSWGVDGMRHRKWHSGHTSFDVSWRSGDTIGVAIDVNAKKCFFGQNGEWKEGFSDMKKIEGGVYPCLSMGHCEITLNLGSAPFLFPGPTPEFLPVCAIGSDAALQLELIRGTTDSFTKTLRRVTDT